MNEQITVIFENERLRVERIQSFWNQSPEGFWYNQADDEWVHTGDHYYIKAHERHRVAYAIDDCEWLCLFIKR